MERCHAHIQGCLVLYFSDINIVYLTHEEIEWLFVKILQMLQAPTNYSKAFMNLFYVISNAQNKLKTSNIN